MPCVAQVIEYLQTLAPPRLAADWDNVGLLLGERDWNASRIMTCLTLTPQAAQEAIEERAGLVVTHHPVLFRAVKRITGDDWQGRMLLSLAAARVAVYSAHTAFDDCAGGINDQLARDLGLIEVHPLRAAAESPRFKLVVFVPKTHLRVVQEAAWSAGAGVIGEYQCCSFTSHGSGTFKGSAAARPAVGRPETLEELDEARLEVICDAANLEQVLDHLRSAHPYEEPAMDAYRLEPMPGRSGSGRMGLLPGDEGPGPTTLAGFAQRVRRALAAEPLAIAGDPQKPITKVAVACGAGGEFLNEARNQGCDVLVTGEARFHACVEAQALGIGLVLAGHYATERPAMARLAERLAQHMGEVTAWVSNRERDPVQWLAPAARDV